MSRKWTLKYGLAAVVVAIIVIAVALFANPLYFLTSSQTSAATSSFLVMLTDPPTVPAGTTVLNLTYYNISLEVVYANTTSIWIPVAGSGTVDLFSLVDMSQTIASTMIPSGSVVDKIEFTIASVEAEVNGTMYSVTPLSNTLVVSIANSQVNPTQSGVLVDFNPTLVQIQATDSDGNIVYYYVLVPSATATVVTDLTSEQVKVGSIVELGQNDREKLVRVVEEFTNNVTIVSASLSVNGNVTSLNVTIMNQGNIAFRIFALTLKGEFNATRTWETLNSNGQMISETYVERIHPDTIPFQVNGTSLIPLFGDRVMMDVPSLILKPGQSATLSFSGVIELQPDMGTIKEVSGTLWMILAPMVVTPIVGDTYTAKLVGAGYQPFNVNATLAQ
jgi:hypothetical protein